MATTAEHPNIVFIFSDQQRWDTLGCYGQRLALSPHLDAMAAEGVRFEHAFSSQPVCGPARACIQAGVYPTEVGCHTNGRALPEDIPTIARYLQDAQYETAYVGKWHLASNNFTGNDAEDNFLTRAIPQHRRGGYNGYWMASDVLEFTSHGYEGYMFDRDDNKVEFEGYRVDCTTNFALDYLRDYAGRQPSQPFFMFISYIEPHHQNDLSRCIGPIGSKQRFAEYDVPGDLAGTCGDWRQIMPDYLGCCWSLDRNVGRIRDQLSLLGLDDNTVVIYTSDHGCHFCTRNTEYKRSCQDNSIRIPFVATGPGFAGGGVASQFISTIDFAPTILHAAGLDTPEHFRGRPVQTILNGTAGDSCDDVFVQLSERSVGRAVRNAQWTYCVEAPDRHPVHDAGSDHYVERFLYNNHADPHQRTNLVNDPDLADVRAQLAARLKDMMAHAGEAVPTISPCA